MNRRAFLGGAGAMIALPLLASLRPRIARGADPVVPRRFVGFYLPCGIVMSNWTPASEGPAWTSPILAPLDAHRGKVLVLTGIDNKPGRSEGGGDHGLRVGLHERRLLDRSLVDARSDRLLRMPGIAGFRRR